MGDADLIWDEARVRDGIAAVVAGAEAALDGCVWPLHPLDDEVTASEQVALYLGAAGMIWALRRLGSSLDLDALALAALERYLETANPALQASLFAGEPGLLLLTRSDDERLRTLVSDNEHNPHWELLYGSAGSILAARAAGLNAEAERLAATLPPSATATGCGRSSSSVTGTARDTSGRRTASRATSTCCASTSTTTRSAAGSSPSSARMRSGTTRPSTGRRSPARRRPASSGATARPGSSRPSAT